MYRGSQAGGQRVGGWGGVADPKCCLNLLQKCTVAKGRRDEGVKRHCCSSSVDTRPDWALLGMALRGGAAKESPRNGLEKWVAACMNRA